MSDKPGHGNTVCKLSDGDCKLEVWDWSEDREPSVVLLMQETFDTSYAVDIELTRAQVIELVAALTKAFDLNKDNEDGPRLQGWQK